jgi:hypothetical protein
MGLFALIEGAVRLIRGDGTEIGTSSAPVRTDPTGTTTQPVSGTVTVDNPTTNPETGLTKDATLTGGTAKAIVRGAAKGSTAAADATVSVWDANRNALDVAATQVGTWYVQAVQNGVWSVAQGGSTWINGLYGWTGSSNVQIWADQWGARGATTGDTLAVTPGAYYVTSRPTLSNATSASAYSDKYGNLSCALWSYDGVALVAGKSSDLAFGANTDGISNAFVGLRYASAPADITDGQYRPFLLGDIKGRLQVAVTSFTAASLPLPTGAATETTLATRAADATLTGGTAKAIARGGGLGTTAAADITSTNIDADHQALDVKAHGAAYDATVERGTKPAGLISTPDDGPSEYNASVSGISPPVLVPSRTAGYGNAFRFDGGHSNGDQYIDVGSGIALVNGTAFSVEAHVYRTLSVPAHKEYVVSNDDGGISNSPNFALGFDTAGKAFFQYQQATGGTLITSGTTVCTTGAHELALCYTGTTWRLFLDGVLEASGTPSGSSLPRALVGSSDLQFGMTHDSAMTGNVYGAFSGEIDCVRLSNTARYTAAYTPAGVQYPNDSGTTFLWLFDRLLGPSRTVISGGNSDLIVAATTSAPAANDVGLVVRNMPMAIGTHANAWSAASVSAGGTSTAVDCQFCQAVSTFGNSSATTTITFQVSQNNSNWYDAEEVTVLAPGGDFVLCRTTAARYVRLKSSGAATITATIAGKA